MASTADDAVGASDEAVAKGPNSDTRQAYTGTYRLLVKGKNINEDTLMATDYLNHFNEIIMLLEMVPSMPECFDDCQEWQSSKHSGIEGTISRSMIISLKWLR